MMSSSATATSRLPGHSRSLRQPTPSSVYIAESSTSKPDRCNSHKSTSFRKPATSPNRLPTKPPPVSMTTSSRIFLPTSYSSTDKPVSRSATLALISPTRSASLRAPSRVAPAIPSRSTSVKASTTLSSPSGISSGHPANTRVPQTTSPGRGHLTTSPGRALGTAAQINANISRPQPSSVGLTRKISVTDVSRDIRKYPPSSSRSVASNPPDGPSSPRASPRAKPPPAHAHRRAKSGATLVAGANSMRPPSGGSSSTTSSTISSLTGPIVRGTKPRAMSQHARASASVSLSANAGLASAQTLKRENSISSLHAKSDKPYSGGAGGVGTLRSRPAFNTLQQHYSPAKSMAPKPVTALFFAPPTPSKLPINMAISAECSRHQNELLLLHLLHKEATATDMQWRESAREKLGSRFRQLSGDSGELNVAEAGRQDVANIQALFAWGSGSGIELESKIQALDSVLTGLWCLSSSNSKYQRVVRRFEKWVEHMAQVEEARDRADGNGLFRDGEVLMVGGLDTIWQEECMSLGRRLDEWRRQLMALVPLKFKGASGDPERPTGLEIILYGCSMLVRDMLTELALMEQIETEAINREEDWVRNMLSDSDDSGGQQAGAIWRAF